MFKWGRQKGCSGYSGGENAWQCSQEKTGEERQNSRLKNTLVDPATIYVQQFSALYFKNGLVAWRNWRATVTRLLAPLILLILALAIDESLKALDRDSAGFAKTRRPEVEQIGPIPTCREDMYMTKKEDCMELAYSPDNNVTREIMDNVVSRNEKLISARAFPSREAVQDFLFSNPEFMIAAVHFVFDGLSDNSTLNSENLNSIQNEIQQDLPLGISLPPSGENLSFPPVPEEIADILPPNLSDINTGRRLEQQFTVPENLEDFTLEELQRQLNESGPIVPEVQGFIIQTNTTIKNFKSEFQHPNAFVQIPLQNAVHREIARYHLKLKNETEAAETLEWKVGFKPFPSPALESEGVLRQILGPFVFAALMFSFVIQISTVVIEKELGLRQALRTMGMSDMAYWSSWGAWEVTLAFLQGHLVAIFGLILQFEIFLGNNYGLLFFLFFLFQLAMSSLALLFASFLVRTQAAVYLGFVIFIVGWIMQAVVAFGVPYTPEFFMSGSLGSFLTVIFSVFPWSLLVKGFEDLGLATENDGPGLKWEERDIYCQVLENNDRTARREFRKKNGLDEDRFVSSECNLSLRDIYSIFIVLWVGFFAVAVYLDNVLKNEVGLRRHSLYFLLPSYWFPSVTNPKDALMHVLDEEGMGPKPEAYSTKDEDVCAEESAARALLNHRVGRIDKEEGGVPQGASTKAWNAIEVYGLKKNYGGAKGCCGRSLVCSGAYECCSCRARKSFWPIKDSWFVIPNNQLFCLLGPNGAGKTTTINTLIGRLPPTHGDALIHGQSIRSAGGLNRIRSMMGVCPQFDVLWPELTGREHLQLYGRIKSARWNWNDVVQEADTLLEKVKLTYAADQRSGAYSGGMKRRLSVAIALLGDPKVVYLDEPTTGMDPISRRYVWDTIQEAKVGRAIILTTHSMEEADILGDRIAIMALGRLRCIGSSLRLKQRFGAGFKVSVSVQASNAGIIEPEELERRCQAVQSFFREQLQLDPTDIDRSYINYLVPRACEEDLAPFLEGLESKSSDMGITDVQLSLASLEEVFLTIARLAALEAAKSNGMEPQLKELPFGSTCLKASLLGLFFPLTIWAAPWWKRIIVGKEEFANANSTVVLPDGSACQVDAGQEQVQDAGGQVYDVIWSLDDQGNLRAQDVKPALRPLSPPFMLGMHSGSAHTILAKDGTAMLQFPNAALPGVPAPVSSKAEAVMESRGGWSQDNTTGLPVALPVAQAQAPSRTGSSFIPGCVPSTHGVSSTTAGPI